VTDDRLTVAAPSTLAKMIAEDSNTNLLRSALAQVVGGTWRVDVLPEGGAAAAGPTPATPAPSATAPAAPANVEIDPRDYTDSEPEAERKAVVDPEAEALRLLHDELGARPVADA